MAQSSPGRLIQAQEAALVLFDLQEKLLPVMAEPERVLQNAVKVVKFARLMGLPVAVCEQERLGPIVAPIRQELSRYEPIPKLAFDCFGSQAFREELSRLDRRAVVILGIEAHICVVQTAFSAAAAGYCVQVVNDATSSRSPENHRLAELRLLQAGITLTSTEMLVYELLKQAGTEEFKAGLALVK